MRRTLLLSLAAFLCACTDPSVTADTQAAYDMAPPPAPAMMMEADGEMRGKVSADMGEQSSTNPSAVSYLAYRYGYRFALPFDAVRPTMSAHQQACANAGPDLCQVLGSSSYYQGETSVSAELRLRAEPRWLEGFVARMKSGVDEAGGRLSSSDMSAEDLTRAVLDTDARLRAQTTLRDRLQGLLETRNAELGDLLALERELARVQGQIESATTTLAALRRRISMSEVNISYETRRSAVSASAFAPVGRAVRNFVGTVSEGLAGVIGFLAVMLPWLVFVILPGLWLARRFWRSRRAKA